MKPDECSVCEGWIQWNEVMIQIHGVKYCEVCYEESKGEREE